mgnify:CR=1 FL=1
MFYCNTCYFDDVLEVIGFRAHGEKQMTEDKKGMYEHPKQKEWNAAAEKRESERQKDPQQKAWTEAAAKRESERQQSDKEGRAKHPTWDKDKSDARAADPHWRSEPNDPRGNS